MPHTYSAALKAHLAGINLTVAIGCKMTRRDGFVLGLTSHMTSKTISGVLYKSQPGMVASAMVSKASSSIDNAEIQGFIQDDSISDKDLRGGLWESARMEFFLYNYSDLTMGTGFLGKGIIGGCKIRSDGMWTVEFRSLEQILAQEIGQITSVTCRYKRLGKGGCPVNVLGLDVLGRAITQTGSIASVSNKAVFTTSLTTTPSQFFRNGMITFTSGLNNGIAAHVQSFSGGVFTLWNEMPLPVVAGDTFSAEEGCDRRIETCQLTFNAVASFDGEPWVPGPEGIYGISKT